MLPLSEGWLALLALGLLGVLGTLALQLVLLLRRPRPEIAPELLLRLGALEQALLALTQGSARSEAACARIELQLQAYGASTAQAQEAARQRLDEQLAKTVEEARHGRRETGEALLALRHELGRSLTQLAADNLQHAGQLRAALNERLAAIQADNGARLEQMRLTVDEKLHATLEQRLGESFKLVSERLEQVHTGLGEMKLLAGSVGDLKRVMSNVRSRGTWGEVQLGALIEGLLTPDQYAQNVKTVPGSNELVEFAIKMPGKTDEQPVWLPIDAKYPVEHYQRLLDAHESADKAQIQSASAAFEASIRLEARKIASKYLSPPHTTDFAVLFLPTEGLFAEVCRLPGMIEALQNDWRIVVSGPTTLAAMLNSLRLGFRTLAIEKRSSEVWLILSAVKTEFKKFGEIVDATHKSIDAASRKFGDIGVRTRAIERKLRGVEDLPAGAAADLLADGVNGADDDEEPGR